MKKKRMDGKGKISQCQAGKVRLVGARRKSLLAWRCFGKFKTTKEMRGGKNIGAEEER